MPKLTDEVLRRLTDPALDVIRQARQVAGDLNHPYARPEHLMLGLLLQPTSVAAEVLRASGVTPEAYRTQIIERTGDGHAGEADNTPLSPRTQRVLEMALGMEPSIQAVGTEHLLVCMIRQGGEAIAILQELGVDVRQIRHGLESMIYATRR